MRTAGLGWLGWGSVSICSTVPWSLIRPRARGQRFGSCCHMKPRRDEMDIIRVLIAEDHAMIREGLKQLLELEPDIKVVAGVADGQQAVNSYIAMKPDIVLMDINMPHKNGLE